MRSPQTLNRYAYTMNDPVNYTDLTGHVPQGTDQGYPHKSVSYYEGKLRLELSEIWYLDQEISIATGEWTQRQIDVHEEANTIRAAMPRAYEQDGAPIELWSSWSLISEKDYGQYKEERYEREKTIKTFYKNDYDRKLEKEIYTYHKTVRISAAEIAMNNQMAIAEMVSGLSPSDNYYPENHTAVKQEVYIIEEYEPYTPLTSLSDDYSSTQEELAQLQGDMEFVSLSPSYESTQEDVANIVTDMGEAAEGESQTDPMNQDVSEASMAGVLVLSRNKTVREIGGLVIITTVITAPMVDKVNDLIDGINSFTDGIFNAESGDGTSETVLPNQGVVNGDVEDAPSVDAGKQGKHVQGHNNNVPSKSQWPQGETGVDITQEGWLNGETLPDGTRVWDTGREIGPNGETGVRVHIDGKGNIHGYPVNPEQYLSNN